jgi:hypothetical protein
MTNYCVKWTIELIKNKTIKDNKNRKIILQEKYNFTIKSHN